MDLCNVEDLRLSNIQCLSQHVWETRVSQLQHIVEGGAAEALGPGISLQMLNLTIMDCCRGDIIGQEQSECCSL